MKPAVKKAIWCVVILLVIAALTSTGVKKVKKSKKHDEKFQNNVQVSNKAMTFEIRPIKKYGAFDKLNRGALHDTQIVTNNIKTRTPLLVPRYKPCDESINEYVQSCSKPLDASNIRPRHDLRNNLHSKLQKQRFKSYEAKQTEDLGHSSSDVDESFKLLYSSHKRATSDCFACKPDKALVEVPVDDYERIQKDEHNITSRSGSSTKYSILDVSKPYVGNNSIPNQNHNENTDYKPKQELTDLSVNEPRVENLTVSCESTVPCDNTCSLDNQNYTINEAEKQFFISLSKFIVNEINIYEGEEKIPRGKLYKFAGYGLTVVHVNSPSFVFKLNYNDKDLVVKYIEDISLAPNEAEITINAKHENIVEVYYSFYTDDEKGFFIVMEAMDCNLCQYAKKHPDKLKDVVKSVVNALQYLHSKDIVHCDLKLGNILVKTVEGKTVCKLCDFGGALYIDGDEVIKPKRFSITDEYVAPETYFSSTFSKKTDIWLLGHTIWFYTQTECIFDTIPGLCDPDKYKEYLESPEDCPIRKNRLEIINKCCTIAPEDRASFEAILQWCNESD